MNIYEDNTMEKQKLKDFWKTLKRKQIISRSNNKLESKNIETRWNELFQYRFNNNNLIWWHKNKNSNKCKMCTMIDGEDAFEHVFRKCTVAQFLWNKWAQYINILDKDLIWESPKLAKPLNIPGDCLQAIPSRFNIINNQTRQPNKVQWKIELQKRIWSLGQNLIISTIWETRRNIIEDENINQNNPTKINLEILWEKTKQNIQNRIRKLTNFMASTEKKQYISKLFNTWGTITDGNKKSGNKKSKEILITFDGGSRGNPGISGSGAIISEVWTEEEMVKVKILNIISIYIGKQNTNNQAEYMGLIYALISIQNMGKTIRIIGDSNMILNILKQVKITKKFQKYQSFIYSILQGHQEIKYSHHYRIKNKTADFLANLAMDRKEINI